MDYKGKYIWIIGASSGIGYALAKELSSRGACLALSARRLDSLEQLKSEMAGEDHLVLPLDVADDNTLGDAAKKIQKKFTQLDSVIFLPALYSAHTQKRKDMSFIYDVLRVNLGGAFATVESVMPMFEKQDFGQIVLCGSVAGYRGLPYGQPYCATKAGVISYAESLKVELEPQNIDVKVINPGFVKTPLTDKNDFPMPLIIEAKEAAVCIAKGLSSSRFEISFPWFFVRLMKTLRLLPSGLYFMIARLMRKKI